MTNQKDQAYTQRITVGDTDLLYWIPNQICRWRADTLSTKEPSTMEWLNRIPKGESLLDVGANVGMYSIYAAATRQARVIAVEPESQNFSTLCKNIAINDLNDRISPFSIALSDSTGLTNLYLSSFVPDGGGSCHSSHQEVDFNLQPRLSPFAQGIASFCLDDAIAGGLFAVPHAIKIDVDGFEHLVVSGAINTLADSRVKTLCIEVNHNLAEHREMMVRLESLGFYYSDDQVAHSMRKEGAFRGCAEVILDRIEKTQITITNPFRPHRSDYKQESERASAFADAISRIQDSSVERDPFPAVYIQDLFPSEYYETMQKYFPRHDQMQSLGETGRVSSGAYPERLVTLFTDEQMQRLDQEQRDFWEDFASALTSESFVHSCISKFTPWCSNRLAALRDKYDKARVRNDALLVNDCTDYAIGPHTDLPHRLISLLFYLPQDKSMKYLGTSFYKHMDPDFRCPGGPHYSFDDFTRLGSAPFLPNSLLMFVRTDISFHGVEPITQQGVERRLLISNIRLVDHGNS